jgi:hypothetical protein
LVFFAILRGLGLGRRDSDSILSLLLKIVEDGAIREVDTFASSTVRGEGDEVADLPLEADIGDETWPVSTSMRGRLPASGSPLGLASWASKMKRKS